MAVESSGCVCPRPSRDSLLTGRIHFRTGIRSWIPPDKGVQLGPRELTIATLLKRIGYETFMAGKWHLNGGLDLRAHTQPQDHGFDEWLALHAWAIQHHENPTSFFRNGFARRRPLYMGVRRRPGLPLRSPRWSFKILADQSLAKVRLYDLAADRFELTDLAGARKDLVADPFVKLRAVHASVEADPLRPGRPRS